MPISEFEGDWAAHRDQIYGILRSSFIDDNGDSTFPTDDARTDSAPDVSVFQALLWAIATGLGHAQEQLERAASNAIPSQAQELLGLLEKDYQLLPDYDASISDRQAALALRARVAKGASRPAIEAALTEMLGADFISYDTNDDPANIVSFPATPGSVGVFDVETAERKIFKLLEPVTLLNQVVSVSYELVADSNAPIAGEVFCFDPDPRKRIENVTIISTSQTAGVKRLTATFTKAHDTNTIACRPLPVWVTTQRHSRVVLSHSAATNEKIRAKVHDYLSRALRGVSTWFIASDAGSFQLGSTTRGLLSCSPFTTTATAPATTSVYSGAVASASTTAAAVGSSSMPGAAVASGSATSTAAAASSKTASAVASATATIVAADAPSNAQKRSAASAAATSFNAAFSLRGPIGSASATSAVSGAGASSATATASATCIASPVAVGASTRAATGAATASTSSSCVGAARTSAVGASAATTGVSGVGSP